LAIVTASVSPGLKAEVAAALGGVVLCKPVAAQAVREFLSSER
jgi:hypothetical protein